MLKPTPICHPMLPPLRAALQVAIGRFGRDLTLRQVRLLLHIEHASWQERQVKCIAAALGVSRPVICRATDKLTEEMLAVRQADPMDGRGCIVAITPQGRDWIRDFLAPLGAAAPVAMPRAAA